MTTIAAPRRQQADLLATHVEDHAAAYYLLLAFITIAAGWIGRLNWGFWTDEAGSFWMSGGGWAAALAKTQTYPGQSLLYAVIASFFYHPGPNQELWLRIPSIIGVLAAGYFLFRLTESILGRGTGYLAVIPFFCTDPVIAHAAYARPYGLALAAATGCAWKFYEFLKEGTRRSFVEYLLFSILVIYLQYFFAFMLGLQFAFAVYWRLRGRGVSSLFWVAPAAWALSLWPLRANIQLLFQYGKTAYTSPIPPTIGEFFLLCLPVGPLLAGVVGCSAVALAFPNSWKLNLNWPAGSVFLTASWLFAAPILFFALARWGTYDLFTSRYLLFVAPAFCIFLAGLISSVRASHHRLIVLFAILGGTVLHPGHLLQVYAGAEEDWRPALATVQQSAPTIPVFVRSGIAESNRYPWRERSALSTFLFAPLTAYPIANPVVPLAYHLTPEVQQYLKDKLDAELRHVSPIMLVANDNAEVNSWMLEEMKARGYTVRLSDRGGYTVSTFEKSGK